MLEISCVHARGRDLRSKFHNGITKVPLAGGSECVRVYEKSTSGIRNHAYLGT